MSFAPFTKATSDTNELNSTQQKNASQTNSANELADQSLYATSPSFLQRCQKHSSTVHKQNHSAVTEIHQLPTTSTHVAPINPSDTLFFWDYHWLELSPVLQSTQKKELLALVFWYTKFLFREKKSPLGRLTTNHRRQNIKHPNASQTPSQSIWTLTTWKHHNNDLVHL